MTGEIFNYLRMIKYWKGKEHIYIYVKSIVRIFTLQNTGFACTCLIFF